MERYDCFKFDKLKLDTSIQSWYAMAKKNYEAGVHVHGHALFMAAIVYFAVGTRIC